LTLASLGMRAEQTDSVFCLLPHSEINLEALYSNPAHGAACVEDFNEDGYADILITGPCYDDMATAYVNLLINQEGKGFTRHALSLPAVSHGSICATRTASKRWLIAVQGSTDTEGTVPTGYVATLDARGRIPATTKKQTFHNSVCGGDILFVDYNGDSTPDLLQLGGDGTVIAYTGTSTNIFKQNENPTGLLGCTEGQCVAADMDGDGATDVVAIDQANGLVVYRNQQDGTFLPTPITASLNFQSKPRLAVADLDQDGRTDIVAFGKNAAALWSVGFYYQTGDHTFTEVIDKSHMGVEAAAVCVADFNADGRPDVLYSGYNERVTPTQKTVIACPKAYMLTGDGARRFTAHVKWNTPGNYPDIFTLATIREGRFLCADFDGDARPDVLAMGTFGTGMPGKLPRRAELYYSSRDASLGQPVRTPTVPNKWEAFSPSEVKIGAGRVKQTMDKEIAYIKSLDINRLFAATLEYNLHDASYKPYGGWEDGGYGCSFAHYTSALSYAYAQTGDTELLSRLQRAVDIMVESQRYNGDGFFAFKDGTTWAFDKQAKEKIITPYGWDENGHPWGNNDVGFPLYAHHKVLAALRDAYTVGGIEKAREGFLRFCDWFCMWTQNFDTENLNRMLESEHGGMAEVLTDAYTLSGKEKYLTTARRFLRDNFAETIAAGTDDLSGRHSNMYCPVAVGAAVHHMMAGFGGGRKSILPGVSGLETIRYNHAFALHPTELRTNPAIGNAKLAGNPLNEDMCEAAALVKNLFVINLVMNSDQQLYRVIAGHPQTSWEEACRLVDSLYRTPVKELA
ncbi:MAG: glycoside hydrolase family 127 protein, partial [Bacteroidaceae bacterium]|nr:glycoside hydrolase family 127 protein [Bacteroidaceae bacterium]